MRISLKLALGIVLGITAVLLVHGYTRVQREIELFEGDIRRDHRTLGYAVALAVQVVAQRSGPGEALEVLEDANTREGRIVLAWESSEEPSGSQDPSLDGVRSIRTGSEGEDELVTRIPLPLSGERPGFLTLRESLSSQRSYLQVTVSRMLLVTLLTIMICAAIIVGFGWLLVGRPMQLLVRKLRRVGEGDLGGPLRLTQRDEMGMLAREINTMCDRLARADERAEAAQRARIAALEQLRHADRLSTVGKLASGVAHELGTPLNVVVARARMISRGESEADEARADAGVIVDQAERITAIIRQLLDFARPRPAQKQPEDLRSVVRAVVGMLQPLAMKKDVEMALEVDPEPVDAAVDAGQIQQVVTNLVMNAVQAQPDGGSVQVHVRRAKGGGCEIVVADPGPGIPSEVVDRVFEPFFTTKDVGEGTGLGLSVAYGIVQEHGGRIDVSTGEGRGARFVVWLPADEL